MKRLLLAASALVLVLSGYGSRATASPATKANGARGSTVQSIAAERERAAFREAETLIREFVPPPGARATRRPPGYGSVRVLRQSSGGVAAEVASVHRFWSVRSPLKTVTAFVRAHRLHGFGHFGAMWYTLKPHYLAMGSSWPAAPDSFPRRYFDVTVVALPRVTVLRVDATVVWTYPRSTSEKVPSGVRMIDLHVPRPNRVRNLRIISSAKVARVIRWFNALPVSPPGVHLPCLGGVPANITLSFRNARGAVVARAKLPADNATACDSIGFTIGSHMQSPLIDDLPRQSFVGRLQQLTGLQLIQNHRE